MTAPATQEATPKPTRRDTSKKTEVARRTVGHAIRHYDPDHRWFVPFIAGSVAYTLAGLVAMTGLPSWVLVAPGVAGIAAGVFLARHYYKPAQYGHAQRALA